MEKLEWKKIINIILKKKKYVASIIVAFMIVGCLYTFVFVKEAYKSSTTLILGTSSGVSAEDDSLQSTIQIAQSQMHLDSRAIATYNELIKSDTSIKEIKNGLRINISEEELKENIKFDRVAKTDIIKITVKHADKNIASDIANKTAEVFSKKMREIYKVSEAYIIDVANPSEKPYNAHHISNIIIFTLCGIVIALGYVIAISISDTTIKSSETIENDIGIKTLISLPNKKDKKQALRKLINFEDEKSPVLQAFKTLRTNVQFTNIHNKINKVMLITSCFSGEGKSYVAANLAAIFAKAGKKVILIDLDMKKGEQATIFNIPNRLGISNYLSNIDTNGMEINERINHYINETSVKNLNVITSGSVPPNSSDLLGTEKLPELIKDLSVFYDLIIMDGAPVLPVADSLVLSGMAGSTILVSAANKTKTEELKKAKRDLQNVGARIIGVVLNQGAKKVKKQNNAYVKEKSKKEENIDKVSKKIEIKKKVLKIKTWIFEHIIAYKKKETQLLLEAQKEEKLNTNTLKNEKGTQKNAQKEEVKIVQDTISKNVNQEIKTDDKIEEKAKIEEKKVKKQYQVKEEKKDVSKNNMKETNIEPKTEANIDENIKENKPEADNNMMNHQKEKILIMSKNIIKKINKIGENSKNSLENIKEKIKEYQVKRNIEKAEKQKQKEEETRKQELIRSEELAEQEKENAILAEIKEQEQMEKQKKVEEEKLQKALLKEQLKNKKQQEKEEKRKYKEQKRRKQKEEARIQEEILEDNLYPKTKYNKNL